MCPENIRYIECKSDSADWMDAWISRVKYSGSKKTVYFNGMALKSSHGRGISGNYYNMENGDEYWISGVKKNEWNRHWAGGGKIMIERSLVKWFREYVSYNPDKILVVIDDIPETDIDRLHSIENEEY